VDKFGNLDNMYGRENSEPESANLSFRRVVVEERIAVVKFGINHEGCECSDCFRI